MTSVCLNFIYGFPLSEDEVSRVFLADPVVAELFAKEQKRNPSANYRLTDIFTPDEEGDGVLRRLVEEHHLFMPRVYMFVSDDAGHDNRTFIGLTSSSEDYCGWSDDYGGRRSNYNLTNFVRTFSLEERAAVATIKQMLNLTGEIGTYLLITHFDP